MNQSTKSKITDLQRDIRNSNDPTKVKIVELLELMLDDAKNRLVALPDTEQLLAAQGEARAVFRLLRELTRDNFNTEV